MPTKVVIFGNNTIGVELTKFCFSRSDLEIIGIRPEPKDDGNDSWQKSLLKFAKENNLPVLNLPKLTTDDALKKIRELKPDIIFSFQCGAVIPPKLISIPSMGIINVHFSRLPNYRGCYPIAWALLNGEEEIGVTIHYIDEGIDTGDILFQETFKVLPEDNGRTVFEKATELGIELFKSHAEEIILGTLEARKQNNDEATYYSIRSIDFLKNFVNWNQNVTGVYNFIKTFVFPPFQYPRTRCGGKEFEITKHEISDECKKMQPGRIVRLNYHVITVAAVNGCINITGVAFDGNELSLRKLAEELKLKENSLFYF